MSSVDSELDFKIKSTNTFLDSYELIQYSNSAKAYKTALQQELLDRQFNSKQLLLDVFSAGPRKVEKCLEKQKTIIKLLLTKSCFREEYFSKKLGKLICLRRWRAVSPLQAAALCGDNFLVLKLLSYLENNEASRLEAAKQLKEVRSRTKKTEVESPAATPLKIADKGDSKESVERKMREEERKKTADSMPFSDDTEYLGPYKELLEAYENFINQAPTLQSDSKELVRLFEIVGEFIKRLSSCGFQEFCGRELFQDGVRKPPNRVEYRCSGPTMEFPLNFDDFGTGTSCALSRNIGNSNPTLAALECLEDQNIWVIGLPNIIADFESIQRLVETLQAELDQIIACLLEPGATIELNRKDIKGTNLSKNS